MIVRAAVREDQPEDLHGLLTPPDIVRALLAAEKAKFPPEIFNAEAEERTLCDWTLQYYFEPLWQEVVFRSTPAGPVVIAIGLDERLALPEELSAEIGRGLNIWMP